MARFELSAAGDWQLMGLELSDSLAFGEQKSPAATSKTRLKKGIKLSTLNFSIDGGGVRPENG
jgi:hypothetical protein